MDIAFVHQLSKSHDRKSMSSHKAQKLFSSSERAMNDGMEKSILPILGVMQKIGLLPFKQVHGSGAYVKLIRSTLLQVASLAFLVLMSSGSAVSLWYNAQLLMKSGNEMATEVADVVLILISILLAVVMAWYSYLSCNSMTQFLRYLAKVRGTKCFQTKIRHVCSIKVDSVLVEETASNTLTYLAAGVGLWLSRVAGTAWAFSWTEWELSKAPLWLVILVLELVVVILVREVSRRYKLLNDTLVALKKLNKKKKHPKIEQLDALQLLKGVKPAWTTEQKVSGSPLDPLRIEGIREAHAYLADAYQHLNSHLALFVLLQLAFLFLTLLNSSVQFLQVCISSKSVGTGVSPCLGHALLVLDSLVRMTLVTVACDAVREEADNTAEAAARLLRGTVDQDALRELQVLGSQVRARKLGFWACGLFTVDRPLLFSICGAVTSYLFILSQLNK
ncbi:gustatory receptor for sugar taste 43a-like isoform X1 [Cloeon dipterum]|uniref:gustatory receptor for sugar taste 43a-like isoform X1 n=1 Tax=Cloeon dipterum TaxID=197152 RepID=UPI00321FD597